MRLVSGFLVIRAGLTLALALAFSFGIYLAPAAEAAYEHLPDEQVMDSPEKEILEEDASKQYMLKLINKDRASLKLPPVVMDDLASAADKIHTDEMDANGYSSHWTMDGKKPDQRYSEVGGKDAAAEKGGSSEAHDAS